MLFLALLSAACVPTIQQASRAPLTFEGPRFDVAGKTFHSFDGAALGLSGWAPQGQDPWAVVVALHGMNDYGEAFYLAGPYWAQHGVATYAYDARGQGRSPRRGVWGGQRLMVEDVRAAIAAARRAHPGAKLAVVGDSMGAATAMATFGGDNPPAADRLVLVAPAVWGWSSLPNAYAATLWVGAHTFPYRPVSPPKGVQRKIVASDNTAMLQKIGRDPHMIFTTRIDAIYGLVNLMERASDASPRLAVPTAFLYGAKDQIIPRPAAEKAARALPPTARTAIYPDGHHMLLRDLRAHVVWDDVLAFLRDPAAPLPSGAAPLISHRPNP